MRRLTYRDEHGVARPVAGEDITFADVIGSLAQYEEAAQEGRVAPCKIGDTVYVIANYGGTKKIKQGVVTEMFFVEGMRLCICVQRIRRGEWGKAVFPTHEVAEAALEEMEGKSTHE